MRQFILNRAVRWLNVMWNAYMKKQRRLNQNLEESDSDDEEDDDSNDDSWATNVTREREEEDQIQDSTPTTQERNLD